MIRPEQIANAKFTPVSAGTYSAEEVDTFLGAVAEAYAGLQSQNDTLMKKLSILAEKVEEYRGKEDAIKNALLDAHSLADSVTKQANERADAVVSEAQAKADALQKSAEQNAAELDDRARREAGEIVSKARVAVASLTERAEAEKNAKLSAAESQAQAIIAGAKADGEQIIGQSRAKYEYYTAELAKIKDEIKKFKDMVETLFSENSSEPAAVIPAIRAVTEAAQEITAAAEKAEEAAAVAEPAPQISFEEESAPAQAAEEAAPAAAEELLVFAAEEIASAETAGEAAAEAAEEAAEEAVAEAAEEAAEETAAQPVQDPLVYGNFADEGDDDGLSIPVKAGADEDDDLFSLFDDVDLSGDDFAPSIDDILPEITVEEAAPAPADAQDENDAFLASINESINTLDDSAEEDGGSDDDDITSLFDDLFE